MPDHFLYYCKYKSIQHELDDPTFVMRHGGGNKYGRTDIQPGDEVWYVTQRPQTGELCLFGRMTVKWCGERAEAAHVLGEELDDTFDVYIIAAEPTERPSPLDITDLAADLRFDSPTGKDRLEVVDGRIHAQSLQAMRRLTPESAALLRGIWYMKATADWYDDDLEQDDPAAYTEGRRILRIHYQRERSPALVKAAKADFKAKHGKLFCEVCGFDFSESYGKLGEGYIEAHHNTPLSILAGISAETRPDDLTMVCANCHRMLHRKPWKTVDELREMLNMQEKSR